MRCNIIIYETNSLEGLLDVIIISYSRYMQEVIAKWTIVNHHNSIRNVILKTTYTLRICKMKLPSSNAHNLSNKKLSPLTKSTTNYLINHDVIIASQWCWDLMTNDNLFSLCPPNSNFIAKSLLLGDHSSMYQNKTNKQSFLCIAISGRFTKKCSIFIQVRTHKLKSSLNS